MYLISLLSCLDSQKACNPDEILHFVFNNCICLFTHCLGKLSRLTSIFLFCRKYFYSHSSQRRMATLILQTTAQWLFISFLYKAFIENIFNYQYSQPPLTSSSKFKMSDCLIHFSLKLLAFLQFCLIASSFPVFFLSGHPTITVVCHLCSL